MTDQNSKLVNFKIIAKRYLNFDFCILHFAFRSRRGANGYAAITATILTLVVALSVIGSFTFFSLKEAASNRAFVKSVESRYVYEAGI